MMYSLEMDMSDLFVMLQALEAQIAKLEAKLEKAEASGTLHFSANKHAAQALTRTKGMASKVQALLDAHLEGLKKVLK